MNILDVKHEYNSDHRLATHRTSCSQCGGVRFYNGFEYSFRHTKECRYYPSPERIAYMEKYGTPAQMDMEERQVIENVRVARGHKLQ